MQAVQWNVRISQILKEYESWIVRVISIFGLLASLLAGAVQIFHEVIH
jgi:hypothetical protein